MTPAPQPQQQKYNCYAAISNEWKTLEEIIGTHTGSGLPKNSDIVRYRNALNGYVDVRLVEKEKEICGRGHNQRYRIRSRPAPSQDLEQTVIEELLAIEGYVNGIRSGDESPKRMCDYISSSIGVIRHVIKKLESLRTEAPK